METQKDDLMIEQVDSVLYAQAEKLLKYASDKVKGKKLMITFVNPWGSSSQCLLNDKAVKVCFGYKGTSDTDAIEVTMYKLLSKTNYQISIYIGNTTPLYYLIPPAIITGLIQSAKMKEDVEVTL
jgi:hypothetical protein